jgi:2-iminobutanoate/2-iminopropanoate deaminase
VNRQTVTTNQAPAAIGPYSQAVRCGNFLYTSGQIGLDPNTGQLVDGIEAQTRRVMENLRAVLAAQNLRFAHVIKTTVYLADLNHFSTVNGIYAEYFPSDPPARSTVEVARLPKDALVEIELIALVE